MKYTRWLLDFAISLLSACSAVQVQNTQSLSNDERWVMLPILNFSETPLAGQRTEAISSTLFRQKGIILESQVFSESNQDNSVLPVLNEEARLQKALAKVDREKYRYAITGSVDEWRYKAGLDGEPAVAFSLRVIDLKNNIVVWSTTGAKTGLGYESVGTTANKLLTQLVGDLTIN